MEGLSTVYEPCVRDLVSNYDFVLFTETFSADFPSHLFPMYDVFISPGVRLTDSATARLSGGVAMLIKKQFANVVTRIHVELDNCIVLKLCKRFMGLTADTILIGLYLPPSQSVYYAGTEIDNGVWMLEHCIIDVFEEYGELPVILFGDFNARTGDKNAKDVPLPDSIFPLEKDECDVEEQYRRKSNDVITNDFGRYLLNVCEQFGLVILNGLLSGDKQGHFTYIAYNGSSVIDYFVVSRSLVQFCIHLNVMPKIESKHMPVEMKMRISKTLMTDDRKKRTFKVQILFVGSYICANILLRNAFVRRSYLDF